MNSFTDRPRGSNRQEAVRSFIRILVVISLCEAAVMAILLVLAPGHCPKGGWHIFLDPILLAGMTAPLLYRLIVRPLQDALQQRGRAEEVGR